MKTNIQPSWRDNPALLFKFRITRMIPGDSLMSKESPWQVLCDVDESTYSNVYIIASNGEEIVRRKRIESTVDFLLQNRVPALDLVPGGAKHLLAVRKNLPDFLGVQNQVMLDVERWKQHDKKFRWNLWSVLAWFAKLIERSNSNFRVVVQKEQSYWTSAT